MLLATAHDAETHLVTCVRLTKAYEEALRKSYGVEIHYVSRARGCNPVDYLGTLVSMRRTILSLHPDVAHVHGAWDWNAAVFEQLSRHYNVSTFVSAHRQMSPDLIGIDFWRHKLPRFIAYQLQMIRKCTAVIAINDTERNDIMQLGIKHRIEILPPLSDDDNATASLSAALKAIYQKGMDTNYYRLITHAERDVVEKAIHATLADSAAMPPAPSIGEVNVRRLFLYAYDEDVPQQFIDGCNRLGLSLPYTLNVAQLPRYPNKKAKPRIRLDAATTKDNTLHLPDDSTAERRAVTMISKAHQLGWKQLTLHNYIEMYQLFLQSDFNEDLVAAELRRIKLHRFTRSMQHCLTKMWNLQSGYYIV